MLFDVYKKWQFILFFDHGVCVLLILSVHD